MCEKQQKVVKLASTYLFETNNVDSFHGSTRDLPSSPIIGMFTTNIVPIAYTYQELTHVVVVAVVVVAAL